VDLTEDSFRALARSSPWRWSSLHFTRRGHGSPVEAWVRRPGLMRVRVDGRDELVMDEPRERAEPVLRPDGLVAERPEPHYLHGEDDPMWQDYTWVAMLDPAELGDGTRVADLAADDRGGRDVWRARVWAAHGYEPRCGCCPLLWSEIAELAEAADGGPTWRERHPDVVYPDGFEVALDVQTSVLVELHPVGGDRPDHVIEVDIHEVDGPVS
jgi:hypothetical protein